MKRTSTISTKKQETHNKKVSFSVRQLMKLPYKVELMPLSKEDGGGYLASIPLLKGCQSDGRTPDEAVRNLREARRAWFTSALKHGDPVPIPQ